MPIKIATIVTIRAISPMRINPLAEEYIKAKIGMKAAMSPNASARLK
jgi:hypothetical protein